MINANRNNAIGYYPRGGFISQYQIVYNAMNNPPPSPICDNQNIMLSALIDNGIWNKFDIFYLMAQYDGADALINWVNPGTNDGTAINAPTFTALEGFTGNGSNSYINTNWNPTDDAGNWSQNDNAFGLYSRSDINESAYDMGTIVTEAHMIATRYLNTFYFSNGINQNIAHSDGAGLFISSRTASNITNGYKDGASLNQNVSASSANASKDFYICCRNNNGSPAGYSTKQFAMIFAGSSMNSGEVVIFTNIIETYMDSNGKGVI